MGHVGYDISYPQCGLPFPGPPNLPPPAFAILGVNNGQPFSPNPCLGASGVPSQLTWAGPASGPSVNTANPGPAVSTRWPRGQVVPRECDTPTRPGDDTADCAYDYGWNATADAFSGAARAYAGVGFSPTAVPWWLDVETANS